MLDVKAMCELYVVAPEMAEAMRGLASGDEIQGLVARVRGRDAELVRAVCRPGIRHVMLALVTSRAFDLLPQDLQARLGKRRFTMLNGDFLEIPLECEAELVAELRQRGYEVSRDDELINVLDGRSFSPLVG